MDGTNKKSMMLGFDFESETFHAVLELFERMEVAEEIYEDEGAPSQTKQSRVDANRDSGQEKQGGESALPSFSEKKRAQYRKNKYIHFSNSDNPETQLCVIHGAGNSS